MSVSGDFEIKQLISSVSGDFEIKWLISSVSGDFEIMWVGFKIMCHLILKSAWRSKFANLELKSRLAIEIEA